MEDGYILAVQDGDKYQLNSDLGQKDVENICSRFDEQMGERVRRAHTRIKAVSDEVIKDPDLVAEYVQFAQKRAKSDLHLSNDLEDRSLDDIVSRVEHYHKYFEAGSAVLFRDINYSGSPRFVSVTMPNFGWWPFSFNDRASSAVAWGGNILFEHSWYRGRRLYMVGVFRAPDFNRFGFNDIASSYIGF